MASVLNSAELKGVFRVYRVNPDGSRELRREVGNIIVNQGLYRILDLAAASGGVIDLWAWGSGGVSGGQVIPKQASDTALTTQDGVKSISSYSRQSNTKTFILYLTTAEGNTPGTINEVAIGASGTTPYWMAMQSFGNETKTASYDMQIEYSLVLTNS